MAQAAAQPERLCGRVLGHRCPHRGAPRRGEPGQRRLVSPQAGAAHGLRSEVACDPPRILAARASPASQHTQRARPGRAAEQLVAADARQQCAAACRFQQRHVEVRVERPEESVACEHATRDRPHEVEFVGQFEPMPLRELQVAYHQFLPARFVRLRSRRDADRRGHRIGQPAPARRPSRERQDGRRVASSGERDQARRTRQRR